MVKNKEQVRHFYYRTWHKITKYIDFDNGERLGRLPGARGGVASGPGAWLPQTCRPHLLALFSPSHTAWDVLTYGALSDRRPRNWWSGLVTRKPVVSESLACSSAPGGRAPWSRITPPSCPPFSQGGPSGVRVGQGLACVSAGGGLAFQGFSQALFPGSVSESSLCGAIFNS